MSIFNIFSLLGGLAMFLFAMDMMSRSLEQTAGGKLQVLLGKITASPALGLLLGIVVTAAMQSSTLTTVMAVGFVNSGIMQFHQAISVIMGANIGTTVTSWILSLSGLEGDSFFIRLLNPMAWSPLLGFAGLLLYKKGSDRKKSTGRILLGFAILMAGMEIMKNAMAPLADIPGFAELFLYFRNPLLGVAVGAVLTALLHSSAASIGILQALASSGAVTYASAMPIIMGQNIGTTITAMFSSAGANKDAKRTAIVHFSFNVIGTLVFLCAFYGLNAVLHFSFYDRGVTTFGIAVVHTLFNVTTTLVLLPFTRQLEQLAYLAVPDDKKPEQTVLLDDRLLSTPSVAAARTMQVGIEMAETARTAVLQAMAATHDWSQELADAVEQGEQASDRYEDVLGTYLVKLGAKRMADADHRTVNTLLHSIDDFERISDYATHLVDTAREMNEKDIHFSAEALEDLGVLESAVQDILTRTVESFRKGDLYAAGKVEPMDQVVNGLVREVKARHIARLQAGTCTLEFGFVLDDLLTSYQRVADHCSNVAVAMIEVAADRFDTHEYLNALKHGGIDDKFEKRLEKYRDRYAFTREDA